MSTNLKQNPVDKIMEKYGKTLSDEDAFSVAKNIQQLADVLISFESKKAYQKNRANKK